MDKYKKIAEAALNRLKQPKKSLNESILYPDGISERMHKDLENDLLNGKHSLGKHPIFPEGDESTFEEKIMGERFMEVSKRYKRNNDINEIDNIKIMGEMMPMLKDAIKLESPYRKELEKLAISMIREEYDMDEDVVEIVAELTTKIDVEGTKKNPRPITVDMEFKNHDEMITANEEVYKRRFLNAMIQGAAKKVNHMYHMVDDELTEIDPRLPNKYSKLMSAADYMYYIVPAMDEGVTGGIVKVEFPSTKNPKAKIHAQAMVFPVLIHELVKGVMELLSAHGLPKNKKMGNYVINKADFLAAEPWDMRLGPGLWTRFTNMIEPDDFHLKHHIYSELSALPVREFNIKMKEIMANTKEGKKIIANIVTEIKNGLKEDEFNEAIESIGVKNSEPIVNTEESEGFNIDDLLGGEDESEGFEFGELL
jgi:hypothetical protein